MDTHLMHSGYLSALLQCRFCSLVLLRPLVCLVIECVCMCVFMCECDFFLIVITVEVWDALSLIKILLIAETTSLLASPACLQTACRCCFVVFPQKETSKRRRASRGERRKRTWDRQISKDWDRGRKRGGEPLLCINSLFASQSMLFPMRLDW